MPFRRVSRVLAFAASILAACAPPTPPVAPPPPDGRAAAMARVHVVMINGGGMPAINDEGFLAQLSALRDTLIGGGVSPDRITVFSGDGADPAPDLAGHDPEPDKDFFLLRGSRQERALAAPKPLRSSELPGVTLRTAGKAEITAYFGEARAALKPGDTLLFYVTDHGVMDSADPWSSAILLWKRERLTVRELGKLFDQLDPGVRVLGVMSQCYAGAFAALSSRASEDGRPHAPFCGYFAAPGDRNTFGCSTEDRARDAQGHAMRIIRALTGTRDLAAAHEAVLLTDDTPDAPLTSSDVHLDGLLRKAAKERGVTVEALADELIGPGFRDDPTLEKERAHLDAVAARYGFTPPRSLADLAQQVKVLPDLEHQLDAANKAWRFAWFDAAGDNVRAFVASSPTWTEKLGEAAVKGGDPAALRALAPPFLADLSGHTSKDLRDRLALYRDRAGAATDAMFRAEVRAGAAIRLRTLLTDVAGRALLARGAPADRAAWEALRACEELRLAGTPPTPAPVPAPTPLPPIAADLAAAAALRPAWTGVVISDLAAELRKQKDLPAGAVVVSNVYPDSPAASVGFEIGDVLLGPPGRPFAAHSDARAWSLLAPLDAPASVEVLRGADHLTLAPVPRALPPTLPSLPPALTVGRTAPALDLRAYRGDKPALADGKPHLVMFWATWCAPCKVALPEVLAFEREKKTQVIAVTDEDKEALDAFFHKFTTPFPKSVAIDDVHRSFDVFGVRVRPLFVLLDGKGTIVARSAGYEKAKGLGLPGWKWKGR